MLLVLGEAGQRAALPQQLVLGADAARRPVEGGAGVLRLRGQRVGVGGGGDVEAGPGAVEGQRAPGAQRVVAPPRQVVLRGVEGGRRVVGAALGAVVVGVLVQFFLWSEEKKKKKKDALLIHVHLHKQDEAFRLHGVGLTPVSSGTGRERRRRGGSVTEDLQRKREPI